MTQTHRRVATDVGGTFTDLVVFDTGPDGLQITTAKSDTTPPDFENGVLNVLDKGGIAAGSVDFMAHGSTVVINALTERKGARVGLITTEGFRDVLEIARGNRPDFFNLYYEKPAPFVPRRLRAEVPGRMTYQGHEMMPLDLTGLPAILDQFRAAEVEAIAICLLHAYANPAHERALLTGIQKLWPDVHIVASHQITRQWREYERTSTAVLSAYVQPLAARYLAKLDGALRDRGLPKSPFIMQSNCGVNSMAAAQAVPITMVESGPASGFFGAAELGRQIGEPNVLALDIGGTTAKCSLIEDGEVRIMTDYWIERDRKSAGYPIMVPVVDLVEIGNGGGSIAWVDEFQKLHVGPQSAGALPGPVAYGRGGTGVTTTDANLWLGRINQDFFCGGTIDADMAAVDAALEKLSDRTGLAQDDVARGIIRIANNNMVNALKLVSLNRGHDPRDFTLVAFGGGGAMHAVALGQELQVKKVVIPAAAAVFSAWGMMMSDLRRDYFATRILPLDAAALTQIEDQFTETEREVRAAFADDGVPEADQTLLRYGQFRYENQEHSTEIALPTALEPDDLAAIVEDFQTAYEREYTYRLDAPVELVGMHLVAKASVGRPDIAADPLGTADASPALKGRRDVDYALEGIHRAAIFDGDHLRPGMAFDGPAAIETAGTTVLIHPQNAVKLDGFGNIHIQLGW